MRREPAGPIPALVALAVSATLVGCTSRPVAGPPPPPIERPAPAKTEPLPGACVDPVADARARMGKDADAEGVQVERAVDLDGDGILDPFVTHSSFCGTGGCTWHLFVARGGCAHHVGVLFGVMPFSRASTANGLVDLEVAARDGCAGMARTETRARFDGTEYVQHEVRRCECPTEPTEGEHEDWDPDAFCEAWRPANEPAKP